jgi:hypothetical protein
MLSLDDGVAPAHHIDVHTFTGDEYQLVQVPLPYPGSWRVTGITVFGLYGEHPAGSLYFDQFVASAGSETGQGPPLILDAELEGSRFTATVADETGAWLTPNLVSVNLDGRPIPFTLNGTSLSAAVNAPPANGHRLTVTVRSVWGHRASETIAFGVPEAFPAVFADAADFDAEANMFYLMDRGVFRGDVVNGVAVAGYDNHLTRLQLCLLLARYLGVNLEDYAHTALPFADSHLIPSWAIDEVRAVVALDIIRGRNIGGVLYFDPNAPITRAEMIALIGRTLPLGYESSPHVYADIESVPAFARMYAGIMTNLGMLAGDEVRPNDPLTRREAAAILVKLY